MDRLRIDITSRPVELLDWLAKNYQHVRITEDTPQGEQTVRLRQVVQMKDHFAEIDRVMPQTPGRIGFTVDFEEDDTENYIFVKVRFT